MAIFKIPSKEAQYVQRIVAGDHKAEREFYNFCHDYCMRAQGAEDFYSQDRFQDAFIQIWTEIQDGRIFLKDGTIWRQPKLRGAESSPMSCSLRSFIVDICKKQKAKENRGSTVVIAIDTAMRDISESDFLDFDREEIEVRIRIINSSIMELSPTCREILTQFYVNGLSLEQIMQVRKENVSKDGLKTSKSKCLQRLKTSVITNYIALQTL